MHFFFINDVKRKMTIVCRSAFIKLLNEKVKIYTDNYMDKYDIVMIEK